MLMHCEEKLHALGRLQRVVGLETAGLWLWLLLQVAVSSFALHLLDDAVHTSQLTTFLLFVIFCCLLCVLHISVLSKRDSAIKMDNQGLINHVFIDGQRQKPLHILSHYAPPPFRSYQIPL